MILQILGSSLRSTEAPLSENPVELFGCVYDVRKKYSQKGKDSSVPRHGMFPQRELSEPGNLARFNHTLQTSTCFTGLTTGPLPGDEHEIISTIKTIRKQN